MRKLAIIGTATTSLHLAPYNDPEYELWGINGLFKYVEMAAITNFTRWFEIHSMAVIESDAAYFERLTQIKIPLYMQEALPEIPASVKYPLETMLEAYPRRYFNSTVDYMLALAIHEGYTDIAVYGVDMGQHDEYRDQKPSCEYWLGFCEGKGISLHIPHESLLLKSFYLYGFEQEALDRTKQYYQNRLNELDRRIQEIAQQEEAILINAGRLNLVKNKAYLLGCRDDTALHLQNQP